MNEINPNLTMMCFDTEGVDGDTSEYEFAWHCTSELISIDQGPKGEEWFHKLQAKHFLVKKYKDHPGSRRTDVAFASGCISISCARLVAYYRASPSLPCCYLLIGYFSASRLASHQYLTD